MSAAVSAPTRDRLGLSSREAAERLAEHGRNEITIQRHVPIYRRVARQLRDPLLIVLLGAIALTLATGDYTDALIIGVVIVSNTGVGIAQEIRADTAVAALAQLAAPMATVLRDREPTQVQAVEIVPADVVVLSDGDVVPADAVVIDAAALLVDESALTGEAVPVDKGTQAPEADVHAGTVVVRGRGRVPRHRDRRRQRDRAASPPCSTGRERSPRCSAGWPGSAGCSPPGAGVLCVVVWRSAWCAASRSSSWSHRASASSSRPYPSRCPPW